ncbi:tyrosine-type recombinase/integrase [Albirhodobacter sp. R86504]|uniref:tyrosine-type recombinase/integrase n=1 Tax=Albirhodobacter sp. R86504 TaxID=3093848 RepID=UPI00367166E0
MTRAPKKALTAAFVRTVKEPGKHFDGNGLFLRVEASGSRRWVQRIMVRGKRTEIGLGSADLVTLAEAREAASHNRKVARSGGDPLAIKRADAAVMTFCEATQEVYRIHRPTWRNPKHAAQFLSTLETYAFPHFGQRKVSEITSDDVQTALVAIWNSKPETARRVHQRISRVLSWAVVKGWRTDNPALYATKALPKHDKRPAHRLSLPYADVGTCLKAVKASNAGATTKLAFEFLLITVGRSGEVRGALWSEIDMQAREWRIPASRMKAKVDHRVPLPPKAMRVLRAAKAVSDGSDLVFPSARFGRPLSDATMSKLIKSLGFQVDIHGFRSSFRVCTQENCQGSREVAEAALAHQLTNKTEAAYARSELFALRRKLMSRWAAYIELTESRAGQ